MYFILRILYGLVSTSFLSTAMLPNVVLNPPRESTGAGLDFLVSSNEWLSNSDDGINQQVNEETLDFGMLNFTEQTLRGPYDITGILFSLPAHWQLIDGSIVLNLTIFMEDDQPTLINPDSQIGVGNGYIGIIFNGVALEKIPLEKLGTQKIIVELPPESLVASRSDGRHILQISIDSGLSCYYDLQPSVTIHDTSHFVFQYDVSPPVMDLRQFPRPLYQQSYIPDEAIIVLPDEPTEAELKAVMAVVSGLARITRGRLDLSLSSVGQLQEDVMQSEHLIFVGKSTSLPLLADIPLPLKSGEKGYDLAEESTGDGVVQIAGSPWNRSKVVLVVSGNTDDAVIKAGQAIHYGEIRPENQLDLALVADVQTTNYEDHTVMV